MQHSDWRLPTVKELSFLLNRDKDDLLIDTAYFLNASADRYWSGTKYFDNNSVWYINFSNGDVNTFINRSYYVYAVRGDNYSNSFIDNNNGTVSDTTTGLMWQQNGLTVGTWEGALAYCENLTLAGYTDWRLSDVNELQSIIDYSKYGPAINDDYFIAMADHLYWTSTTNPTSPPNAFYSLSVNGVIDGGPYIEKTQSMYLRCVRGPDYDDDGVSDYWDNCFKSPNSGQLDSYPPQGNGIGDACDCEGNFNCTEDQDVDGSDAFTFKVDFGRSIIVNPCIAGNTCNGDFLCDGDVDGSDAFLFKSDFGRSSIQNPCPACVSGGPWCTYQ